MLGSLPRFLWCRSGYQEVKLLGALYDNRLRRVAETSNQFFLDLKNLIRQLLFRSKISIENIDLVLTEEGYEEKPAFKEFFGNHFGKDLMFFQPSIVAVGAAVLCCWLLKPVKDFNFWGDYEVLLYELTTYISLVHRLLYINLFMDYCVGWKL